MIAKSFLFAMLGVNATITGFLIVTLVMGTSKPGTIVVVLLLLVTAIFNIAAIEDLR